MTDDVRVFGTATALMRAAAGEITRALADAVAVRGEAAIVLSGGSTPEALYAAIAADHLESVAWGRVDLYWGDERYVAHDDTASNFRMARETLIVHLPSPPGRVHPMPTSFADPSRAAAAYEATIARIDRRPRFDVVLIGIGADGHVASLFPGAVGALTERSRRVVATTAPVDPTRRLSLTLPALLDAERVHVIATGAAKAEAIGRAWNGAPVDDCPASAIRAAETPVTWWLDRAAAASLEPR